MWRRNSFILVLVFGLGMMHGAESLKTNQTERLDTLLEKMRVELKFPAVAAAVFSGDELLGIGAAGVRKIGSKIPVTIEDKFHLGSCTKSMTALLAALLVEEGKLSFQSKVGEIFPEWNISELYRDITVRTLMEHRGGLPTEASPKLWAKAWKGFRGSATEQRSQFLQELMHEPPEGGAPFPFIYSNAGYSLIGAMIERKSNLSWEQFIRKKLFEPLGMDSAGFGAPSSPGKLNQPAGHQFKEGAPQPMPRKDNPQAIAPAGKVHCSIGDFARYGSYQLRILRGRESTLSSETMKQLYTPEGDGQYAGGWFIIDRKWAGGRALTHAGSNTLFYSVMWLAPEKNIGIAVSTNIAGSEAEKGCDRIVVELITKFIPSAK